MRGRAAPAAAPSTSGRPWMMSRPQAAVAGRPRPPRRASATRAAPPDGGGGPPPPTRAEVDESNALADAGLDVAGAPCSPSPTPPPLGVELLMRALLASPTAGEAVKRRLLRLGAERGVDWSAVLASAPEPVGWRDEPLPAVSMTVNVSIDVPVDGLSGSGGGGAKPRGFAPKKGFGPAAKRGAKPPAKTRPPPPTPNDDTMPVALRAALTAYTDGERAADGFRARCAWDVASVLGVVADRDLEAEVARLLAAAPASDWAWDPVTLVSLAARAAVDAAAAETEAAAAAAARKRAEAEARAAESEAELVAERAEIEAAQAALDAAVAAREEARAVIERAAAATKLAVDAVRRSEEAAANRRAAKAEVDRLLQGGGEDEADKARLEREQVVAGAVQAAEAAVDAAETKADADAAEAAVAALEADEAEVPVASPPPPARPPALHPAAAAAAAASLERAQERREAARQAADDALRRAEEVAARRKAEAAAAGGAATPTAAPATTPCTPVARPPNPPRVVLDSGDDDSDECESDDDGPDTLSRRKRRGVRAPIKAPVGRAVTGYLAPALRRPEAADYKAAGVLIYTFSAAGELLILLGRTIIGGSEPNSAKARRRSWNLLGGKRCARDAAAEATAIREMTEETGGLLTQATLRGPLSPVLWYPSGSYAVFPHGLPPGDEAWSLPERFDARRRVGRASVSAGRDTANLAWVPLSSLTSGRRRLHIFMAEMLAHTRLVEWLEQRQAAHALEPPPPGRRLSPGVEPAFQDGRLLWDDDDVWERPGEGAGGWPPPTPPPQRHPPLPPPPAHTWPAPRVTTWADARRWRDDGGGGAGPYGAPASPYGAPAAGPYADDRGFTVAAPGAGAPWMTPPATSDDGRRRRRPSEGEGEGEGEREPRERRERGRGRGEAAAAERRRPRDEGAASSRPGDRRGGRAEAPAPSSRSRRPRPSPRAEVVDTGDSVWAVSSVWEEEGASWGREARPPRGGASALTPTQERRERRRRAAARTGDPAVATQPLPSLEPTSWAPPPDPAAGPVLARPVRPGGRARRAPDPPPPPPPSLARPRRPRRNPETPATPASALGLAAGFTFLPKSYDGER